MLFGNKPAVFFPGDAFEAFALFFTSALTIRRNDSGHEPHRTQSTSNRFCTDPVSAFAKKPKSQEAVEGSTVVFEAVTEKPDAKVRWQCNLKDVATGDRYAIAADGSRHSLSIQDVTREDANTYAVIAGGSKVKFDLKVVPKPGGRR